MSDEITARDRLSDLAQGLEWCATNTRHSEALQLVTPLHAAELAADLRAILSLPDGDGQALRQSFRDFVHYGGE